MLHAIMESGDSVIDFSRRTFQHQDSRLDIYQVGKNQRKSKNEFNNIS